MRTFEFDDGKSRKFWHIDLQGTQFTVTYGRLGTQGQAQTKKFAAAAKAQAEHDKLVKEKLGKGYVETAAGAAPTAKALENALAADPDDLAAHAAYADFLAERGDPRGEFIQVQLALEDPARPAKERKPLQEREQELLQARARAWLGDLAPVLLDQQGVSRDFRGNPMPNDFQFARGWLDSLRIPALTVETARVLARAPQLRLLRRLLIEGQVFEEPGDHAEGADVPEDAEAPGRCLFPLLKSPYLTNVCAFHLGEPVDMTAESGYHTCHTDGTAAVALVKKMPRLEELHLRAHRIDLKALFGLATLEHLRVLQVYHMEREYPLSVLARNAHLGQLTDLFLHPHGLGVSVPAAGAYLHLAEVRALLHSRHLKSLRRLQLHLCNMGDAGCQEIVRSGILPRLKVLDLRHGCVTDEGARTLAACPDLARLEALDLGHNALSAAGISMLRAVVPAVRVDRQRNPDETDNGEYLCEGDFE